MATQKTDPINEQIKSGLSSGIRTSLGLEEYQYLPSLEQQSSVDAAAPFSQSIRDPQTGLLKPELQSQVQTRTEQVLPGALGRLTPGGDTSGQFNMFAKRLEGQGLSSAAAASAAQRMVNLSERRKFGVAVPLLGQLEAIIAKLNRAGESVNVGSSTEAFLTGALGG